MREVRLDVHSVENFTLQNYNVVGSGNNIILGVGFE